MEETRVQVKALLRELRQDEPNVAKTISILELWLDDLELAMQPPQKEEETFAEYLNRKGYASIGLYAKEAENAKADS